MSMNENCTDKVATNSKVGGASRGTDSKVKEYKKEKEICVVCA